MPSHGAHNTIKSESFGVRPRRRSNFWIKNVRTSYGIKELLYDKSMLPLMGVSEAFQALMHERDPEHVAECGSSPKYLQMEHAEDDDSEVIDKIEKQIDVFSQLMEHSKTFTAKPPRPLYDDKDEFCAVANEPLYRLGDVFFVQD